MINLVSTNTRLAIHAKSNAFSANVTIAVDAVVIIIVIVHICSQSEQYHNCCHCNVVTVVMEHLCVQDFVRMMYPNATESNVRQLMSMGSDHKAVYRVVMTPERIREMKATFKECDTDGSGDVSRTEFIEGIQNAGGTPLSC